jgi:putative lipoprotein
MLHLDAIVDVKSSLREKKMSLQIIKIVVLLMALGLQGACGQKGELYLPGEKQTSLFFDSYIA